LSLELDHINGDNTDDRVENLRFLCPNCHSQTDNWRGRKVVRTTELSKLNHKHKTNNECLDCKETITDTAKRCKPCNRKYTHIEIEKQRDVGKCKDCNKNIGKRAVRCGSCASLNVNKNRRVVQRPSKEKLLEEIEEMGYSKVGRKYGVSDNAIRKWVKVEQ
jgi:RNA polymerase subunit RPABC4/transcription elongation factor Spt4